MAHGGHRGGGGGGGAGVGGVGGGGGGGGGKYISIDNQGRSMWALSCGIESAGCTFNNIAEINISPFGPLSDPYQCLLRPAGTTGPAFDLSA